MTEKNLCENNEQNDSDNPSPCCSTNTNSKTKNIKKLIFAMVLILAAVVAARAMFHKQISCISNSPRSAEVAAFKNTPALQDITDVENKPTCPVQLICPKKPDPNK